MQNAQQLFILGRTGLLTCPARRLSHCYLLLSTTAPYDCALQPCWVCLVFCKQAHPAKKGRENTTAPPPLHCIFITPPQRDVYSLLRLSREFQTQRRRGEREELITNRGIATFVFVLRLSSKRSEEGEREKSLLLIVAEPRLYSSWVCVKRFQTQRRGRERMSGSYRYRGRATSGIVLGL
jgi:hypothetical protein